MSHSLLEAASQAGLLLLGGAEVGAVFAASNKPKGHQAPCPCSPHSQAHLLPDLKLRKEKNIHIDWDFVWYLARCISTFFRW